ncbi:MAG: hypothetical protein OXH93_12170, partial [Caldilineaceae bacterium]|nr:hypothetical protein [Caldilineaceae bacterium]
MLAAPPIESLLGHADPAGSLSDYAALGFRYLSLSELFDFLLRRMSPLGHLSPFYGPIPTYYLDQFLGGRSALRALIRAGPIFVSGATRRALPLQPGEADAADDVFLGEDEED